MSRILCCSWQKDTVKLCCVWSSHITSQADLAVSVYFYHTKDTWKSSYGKDMLILNTKLDRVIEQDPWRALLWKFWNSNSVTWTMTKKTWRVTWCVSRMNECNWIVRSARTEVLLQGVCVHITERLWPKRGRHTALCSFLFLMPLTICIWYILNVAYCILCVMVYTLCNSEMSVFTSTKGQVFIIW